VPPTTLEAVLQRIRLRARRRIAWLRTVWSQQLGPGGRAGAAAVHAEIDGYLCAADTPEAEMRWYAEEEELAQLNEDIAQMEAIIHEDDTGRLGLLVRIFGLNSQETDVLEACLALAVESNLGRVYAYLQDDSSRPYVTAELVARLFGHDLYLTLGAGSPLKTWGLITEHHAGPAGPPRLECDPFIRNWLLGLNEWGDSLIGRARIQAPHEPLAGWPVEELLHRIARLMSRPPIPSARVFVAGSEGAGRGVFAACICQQLGLQLAIIDSDLIPEGRWQQVFLHAQRYAWLNKVALAWKGAPAREQSWSTAISPYPLQFIIGETDEEISPVEGLVDLRVELQPLSLEERDRLWRQLLPGSIGWPEQELTALVRRHNAVVGQIVEAANKSVGSAREASEALRESSRRRLGELAQQMISSFTWDDLIIPPALRQTLQDFYYEAGERAVLWEQPAVKRLFPQGKGLFALFSGLPGTGKTMAAQVVANALQLDLFRIDLSSVVSKYVGETSKNIERILTRAQRMDIVLLFDEADALFGKRTEIKDAHDRFANTDTNYLLQAIEQYPGVAILSSNKKNNMDEGFLRRLRYVMDFPRPDATQRLALWRRISAELGGAEAAVKLDPGLQQLAAMAELTGAQIKFALLSALFIATREKSTLTIRHVVQGLEKELLKDERPLPRQVKEYFR
jgi:hypothetical protein